MTYSEYLKSLGASAEEITLLDTAVGRRAYEKMQADNQAALDAAAAKSREDMEAYRGTMNEWYETKVIPDMTKANADAVTSKANEERAKAAILEAAKRDEGLKQVAINMGWPVDGTPAPTPTPSPAPSTGPKDYFTRDEVVNAFEKEADAIALAQDIMAEHSRLFPGQSLSFRDLNKEAKAAKKPLEQFWQEKYKVSDARNAITAAAKAADEARIRKDERDKADSEWAAKYGNPMTRIPMPSSTPFTKVARPEDGKQPWERTDTSGDRVKMGIETVMKKFNPAQN